MQSKRLPDISDLADTILPQLKKLDDGELCKSLCTMLREPRSYIIRSVIRHAPRPTIIEAFKETMLIQASGGMKKHQGPKMEVETLQQPKSGGSEFKTAGGVFLLMIKQRVDKSTVQAILKVEKVKQLEKKKAMKQILGMMSGEKEKPQPAKFEDRKANPEDGIYDYPTEDMKVSHRESCLSNQTPK